MSARAALAAPYTVICIELNRAADVWSQLASIRRIITTAGNIRYDAPRTSEGHADRAWALALALYACSTPNAMLEALSA